MQDVSINEFRTENVVCHEMLGEWNVLANAIMCDHAERDAYDYSSSSTSIFALAIISCVTLPGTTS